MTIRKFCGNEREDEPDLASLLLQLEDKDQSTAYRALQELEKRSDETGLLYKYCEKFADMVNSEKYAVRVRGFRLFCRQARWDTENLLDENIDDALRILEDEKPTAVRQALAALPEVVRYKPDLSGVIKGAVSHINYQRYKDTMQGLIAKDIQHLLELLEEVS